MTQITVEGNSEWLSVNCSCEECAPIAVVVTFNAGPHGCTGILNLGSLGVNQHGTDVLCLKCMWRRLEIAEMWMEGTVL